MVRPSIRTIPWLLAIAGLAVPLVGSGFVLWPIVTVWACVLTAGRVVVDIVRPTRGARLAVAAALVPVLVLLAWEGGLWLLPADVAWLLIELRDRPVVEARS